MMYCTAYYAILPPKTMFSEPCARPSDCFAVRRGVVGMTDGDITAIFIHSLNIHSAGSRARQRRRGRGRAAESPISGEEKDNGTAP
jgi:hypothetical protein